MIVSWLALVSLLAALLLAAAGLGALLLRRSTAAARHQVWTLGVIGALALPLLCAVLPSSVPTLVTSSTTLRAAPVLVTPQATSSSVEWLAMVWAAGALVVLARLLRGHVAAHRLVRAADPHVDAGWSIARRDAAASLMLARPVELRRSADISSPMTVGILRPRVLLPVAAEDWSPARLRAVLVHELGHVQRHDTLAQLAAQLACAAYWWNPLAWLAAARMRLEREHACDDLVLHAGTLASTYATDLLDVARSLSAAPGAAICMVDHASTAHRLRRILDATAPRHALGRRFRFSAYALTAAITLACTTARPGAPRASVSVGAPQVRTQSVVYQAPPQGDLDLALVAAEVQRRLPMLEQCYQRRLAANPALAGTIGIHWYITETGEVPESCITEDTTGDAELAACVNVLVTTGVFPKPRGGTVDVLFPFVFNAPTTVAQN